jgi:hypothetical protein
MNEPDKGRRNAAASVRARLLNKARAEKLDFNLLLTRYALERMLYRLSVSEQRGQFLLKGALLFDLWFDLPHRPTHDADLLGFGSTEIPHLEKLFREISQIASDDGIVLWVLARHSDFDGAVLAQAIRATFERRGTAIPSGAPLGLTDEFGLDEQKTKQWQAFQRKNTLEPMPLTTVIAALLEFLLPVLATGNGFDQQWRAGAGWNAT